MNWIKTRDPDGSIYLGNLQAKMPFNSVKSAPWSVDDITRVLVKHNTRYFDPKVSRDVQDLFNLLIRQRQTDIRLKYQIALLAEQKYQEEVAADQAVLAETVPSLLRCQAE